MTREEDKMKRPWGWKEGINVVGGFTLFVQSGKEYTLMEVRRVTLKCRGKVNAERGVRDR